MKTLPLVASLLLGLASIAPAARAAEAASLTVTFKALKTTTGAILFAVVNGEEAYNDKAPAIAQVILPVAADTATRVLPGLAPGSYAIKAFHDVNGDGKMNANLFGMPTEPFAFSNNAVANMGPAKWADASFEVTAGAHTHIIDIN